MIVSLVIGLLIDGPRKETQLVDMFEALEEWMLDDLLDMARQFDYTVNLILNKHLKEINVIKVLSKVQKQRNLLQEPYSIWLTLPDPNNENYPFTSYVDYYYLWAKDGIYI